MEPHASNIACLFICVWYLTLCILLHVHYVPITVLFLRAGRVIRISLLMHCVMAAYGMIISRAMRVTWDVYSVFSPALVLGATFGNSLIIILGLGLWGGAREDDFPQTFTLFPQAYSSF